TPPLASDALATRIIFPSVGVIQISFNLTGLPASLGKRKKAIQTICMAFVFFACKHVYLHHSLR
ncbi:TPA: hypothetical protein ACX6RR_003834, partial [Photobacterium damselae]